MSEKTKTYWVRMTHTTDTNYIIEATSPKQVTRIFNKMLGDATVSSTGIDYNTQLMMDAEDGLVRKSGISVYDRPALLSLEYQGTNGEVIEEIDEISEYKK